MVKSQIEKNEPENLVHLCRRLYTAIDKMDQMAAVLVNVSRNDLRCLNLLSEGPQKPNVIATELGLTSGSVTSLLDRLERGKLARRDRNPNDRRGVLVHPTDHLFATLGPLYKSVADELTLTAREYTQNELDDAIRYLSDALAAYEKISLHVSGGTEA